MSVLINSNAAATLAANNLAASNGLLQRSLNRLSSGSRIVNPADDAGGLAVSMKLSATAKRLGAAGTNLGNSRSFLQSQDGVLKTVGAVLDRVGELKTLASDPTKNSSDLANYNAEYTALRAELSSLALEEFNGISLFGSESLSVDATGEGNGTAVSFGGMDLLGTGSASAAFAPFNDNFNNLANWTNGSTGNTTAATASNYLTLTTLNPGGTGNASVTTSQSFSGPMEITFDATTNGPLEVDIGGVNVLSHPSGGFNEPIRIAVDASGNYATYVNGSLFTSGSGISGANQITLTHTRQPATSSNVHIQHFSVTSTPSTGTSVNEVATGSTLSALSLSSVTSALQEVATFRAQNGGQQSRLQFASEVLATNKANLESANSRIIDVDVAAESTQLTRWNILVQAGTAMLTQANQSPQAALRLLG